MRSVNERKRSAGKISRFGTFLAELSIFRQSGFSRFAFLSLGFLTISPAIPEINRANILSAGVSPEPVKVVTVDNREELCRWKKDFSLFSTVAEKGKLPLETELPCQDKTESSTSSTVPTMVPPDNDLEATISTMVSGYPIAVMAPAIASYDRAVAALIVGIAKKESDWGKHVPLTPSGEDCFNYWGYKGAGTRGTAMGHGCFGSPEEAVIAVGNRLTELVAIRQGSDPSSMIIWKCGSSCATHSKESVRKWISDVDIYYQKIAQQ